MQHPVRYRCVRLFIPWTPGARSWASLGATFCGALLYACVDANFEIRAYSWLCCWYLIFAFDQVYIKYVVDNVVLSAWGRTYYVNLLAAPPVFFVGICTREFIFLKTFIWTRHAVLYLSMSCILGVLMSFSSLLLRRLVSATTFTVIGNMCKIATVVLNCLVWDKHATAQGLGALSICFLGGVTYQQAPLRSVDGLTMRKKFANSFLAQFITTSGSTLVAIIAVVLLYLPLLPADFRSQQIYGVPKFTYPISSIFTKGETTADQRESFSGRTDLSPEVAHKGTLAKARNRDTLVIVIGTIRGGGFAWNSFRSNLLDALNADFAYMGPDTPETMSTPVEYNWQYSDPLDWGPFFDDVAHSDDWRFMCNATDPTRDIELQFLGGVSGCHPGSAGILLAYRELLRRKMVEDDLILKYKWFVLTRSDHVYLCQHEKVQNMRNDSIHIPDGEGAGALTDRHAVIPSSLILKILNVTQELFHSPTILFQEFLNTEEPRNLEGILMFHYLRSGIRVDVMNRTMFAIKRSCDHSRWSPGIEHPFATLLDARVKYEDSLRKAELHCGINFTVSTEQVTEYHDSCSQSSKKSILKSIRGYVGL